MFGPFERAVAGRYLRARRGERFVSVIAGFSLVGIALGVATLIIVMSVMNGFRQELLGRILGLNGHLGIYGVGQPLVDYDAVAARVRGVPGVVSVMPMVESAAGLKADRGGGFTGGVVRGVRLDDLRRTHVVADNIRAGSLDAFKGNDAVAIGVGLAQKFGIGIGDRIQIYAPESQSTPFGSIPRGRAYTVVALFQVGFNEADTSFVYMPLDAAQILFRVENAATQIEVVTTDPDRVREVNRAIRAALGPLPVRVIDWTQNNNSFFAAVEVERNVMFLILTLIILVAAFNIVSSLIMMVKDKTKDIAVLRTIGAGSGSIMRIFLMCGASVGIAGTLLGTLLGVVFCLNIETIRGWLESLTGTNLFNPEVYFLSRLPAVLQWNEVLQVVGMALVLSLLATLYPSWRAARTDPVEALRHE
ncbi:lipoprotein-releasing ABC transporter permease subunit [Limobrevibacterium gyesilva]|uniref:Lipoprotein-releasing ABC transporter permease subunit n=1 Tax=Limobrevibacterium gyesilva TaxID=2991712 RepID=A0AA41YK21_9PROT|nr:lipoprotein-releasing ABC transporter permease subunit [Limobrevibacterium gyesilva]MCW3475214.1 lipoprotein-releasing ABC transporter permease subunit [Limobrevibacterium gyesilva]